MLYWLRFPEYARLVLLSWYSLAPTGGGVASDARSNALVDANQLPAPAVLVSRPHLRAHSRRRSAASRSSASVEHRQSCDGSAAPAAGKTAIAAARMDRADFRLILCTPLANNVFEQTSPDGPLMST